METRTTNASTFDQNVSSTDIPYSHPGVAYFTVWHVVYGIICLPTVFGNLLVILSVARFKKLRSSMYILTANLAVSDFLVGVGLIPYNFIADFTGLNSGKYFCLVRLSTFVIALGGSCFSLLLISIERCAAVLLPLAARYFFTKRKLASMVCLGWLYVFLTAALPIFGWNSYYEGQLHCISDELWTKGYKRFAYWQLMLTVVINVILYTVVIRIAARKARKSKLRGEMYVHYKSERDIHKLHTFIFVLGLFALCWLPHVVVTVLLSFYDTPEMRFIRRCCLIPGFVNSSINWLIHGWRIPNFRVAFKALLLCRADRSLTSCRPNRGQLAPPAASVDSV